MEKINYAIRFYKRGIKLESELFLEMSQNGSRKRLATRLFVRPEQWDKHKQQVVRHPLSEEYNYYLMQYRLRFEQREMYLWRLGKEPSIEEVIKSDGVVSSQRSQRFLQYAQHCLEDSLWKESTKQNRRVTLSYWEKKMGDTSFFDIEERDIKRFLRYLKEDKLLSTNTIAKHLRHLKIFANMAVRDDLWPRKENPFERIHIKIENSPRPHLEQSELIKLESLASKESLPWLDAFLFCVYSGLRYSDFISLNDSSLYYENTGACWLSLRMKKTAHYLRLPLHALFEGKALRIVEKYKNNLSDLFRLPDNATLNRYLKKMAKNVGIQTNISFHTARHSFATLLLQQGIEVTVIQKLLGHSNLQTTMHYAVVTEEQILSALSD